MAKKRMLKAGEGPVSPTPAAPTINEHEASRYCGLSRDYLRKARARNRGPAFLKIGKAVRYRISDLDAWLSAKRVSTRECA
jgi:predicted DNA-binding transcriptional regulator AlpA